MTESVAVLDVSVVAGSISRLQIDGDRLTCVQLEMVEWSRSDTIGVSTWMAARTDLFSGIGIEPTPHPASAYIETDLFGKTTVPGVLAAGNASDISAQVSGAIAEGARESQHINADLIIDDLGRAVAAQRGSSHESRTTTEEVYLR